MKKIVITSGYFNPLHVGHVNLIREAKRLGDFLVVIVNNDEQVKFKGSCPFMPQEERMGIVRGLRNVDEVFLSIDCTKDGEHVPISESLKSIGKKYQDCELFFAKGGDRSIDNIPESEVKVCQEFNIKVINGVGGGKVQSSSWLLTKANGNGSTKEEKDNDGLLECPKSKNDEQFFSQDKNSLGLFKELRVARFTSTPEFKEHTLEDGNDDPFDENLNDKKNLAKIGILGVGMVGGALKKYFEKMTEYHLSFYDKKGLGSMDEVNKADFIYICVPTPYVPGMGCDTSMLHNAIEQISGEKIVIIKSTIPPGTTEAFQKKFPQHKILFNPEFLKEVTTNEDMFCPDRQIVGYTEKSYNVAMDVLQQLPLASYERLVPAKVAELTKYAGNTWFAVKVGMNNELYNLAKKIGFSEREWEEVMAGISTDRRIGRTHLKIMHEGKRGYFGKCLPKDIKALIEFSERHGVDMPIRKATNNANDELLNSQGIRKYI